MNSGCETCHIDHGQSLAGSSSHYLKATPTELCVTCHKGVVAKEFMHDPVRKDCTLCHDPHADLKTGLRAQSNALCLECHSEASKSKFENAGSVKLFGGRVTVPPRYFENLHLLSLANDRGHPVSNHPVLRQKDAEWPAVSCIVCHKPHGADKSASLLVTETETFESLCQECHK
jgi:predicted CXXCH cytochrome family protein